MALVKSALPEKGEFPQDSGAIGAKPLDILEKVLYN
jgi:hypothetical protein